MRTDRSAEPLPGARGRRPPAQPPGTPCSRCPQSGQTLPVTALVYRARITLVEPAPLYGGRSGLGERPGIRHPLGAGKDDTGPVSPPAPRAPAWRTAQPAPVQTLRVHCQLGLERHGGRGPPGCGAASSRHLRSRPMLYRPGGPGARVHRCHPPVRVHRPVRHASCRPRGPTVTCSVSLFLWHRQTSCFWQDHVLLPAR